MDPGASSSRSKAIKRLMAGTSAASTRSAAGTSLAETFTEDATCSYGDGKFSFQGRDAILDFLRKGMSAPSFHSAHHVHHPEIELTSETTARGIWALEDTVIEKAAGWSLRGAAFYADEYVKKDGRWLIQHTGYTRIYEESHQRKDIPSLRLTASRWGAADEE
jgi:uncharacterized protein (TIGR02246 family)